LKDKFTVTISDIEGSKNYTLNQIVKKFVLYFILFIAVVIFFGIIFIFYLSSEVEELRIKEEEINQRLLTENLNLQTKIDNQIKYYQEMREKIGEVELLLGTKTSSENVTEDFDNKVDDLTISAVQRFIVLQLIPNGPVLRHNGISANFGSRFHPIREMTEKHHGLDLRADIGTPVYAPAHGVVEFADVHRNGYGALVVINHGFGFKTYYAHLDEMVVKYGQFVSKGTHIANSGNSGLSTGPHLHYEVRFLENALDPINFINWGHSNFESIFEKEKKIPWGSLIREMMTMLNRIPKQP
jgi:murein DD-endopeptidase MepM/ murein hydrolase activator NlpD